MLVNLITPEMENWFTSRTESHIKLVQKYCKKLYQFDSRKFNSIIERSNIHDLSKFREPERSPYILTTWCYKFPEFKLELDETTKKLMHLATEHHVKFNSHHPEFHSVWSEYDNLINPDNRDSNTIPKIINAFAMPDINIGEMVCDWCAVSEERNTNPIDWADSNISKRWLFSNRQVELIYYLIHELYS